MMFVLRVSIRRMEFRLGRFLLMNESDSPPLAWRYLLPALLVPLLGSLFYFVWLPDSAFAQVTYGATKVFTLVYPLCFVGWKQLFTERPVVSWKKVAAVGMGSGLLICGAGVLLMLSPVGEMIRAGSGPIQEKGELLGFTEHFLLFAVFISLFHSALEEYYWRRVCLWKAEGAGRALDESSPRGLGLCGASPGGDLAVL